MSNVKIKLNSKGIQTLLKSNEVKDYIEIQAKSQADPDSHVKTFIGCDRANAYIYPNTKEHPK